MTATVFAALGEPTRLSLVQRLVTGGPASITRLGEGLGSTRQAITKHLRILTQAGVVRSQKQGREQLYELETAALRAASAWLQELSSTWDTRLLRLKQVAEE